MSDVVELPPTPAPEAGPARSAGKRNPHILRVLFRRPAFVVGVVVLAWWVLCAICGEWIAPHDPYRTDVTTALQPPSLEHLFGTDSLGRDVLSRVMAGSQSILTISLLGAILAIVLGTAIGLAMGYFGKFVDQALSRLAEAVMALPNVVLALLALTALGRTDATLIIVVGGGFGWVVARTIRSAVLVERNSDYVASARVRGENALYIMFGEILPNVFPIIIVEFTVRVGLAIFSVASLSFLGFGVQPPSPDWGLQVASSYSLLAAGYWWPALFPSLAIASLVIAIYLIAETAREALER